MILTNNSWEHVIRFEDGSITHLAIENPVTFRNYILELHSQINGGEGSFVLSENNKEVSFNKKLAILTDPICFSFDDKKINTKIAKDLVANASSGEYCKNVFPLLSSIEQLAEELVDSYPMNISYDMPDIAGLIKMLSFHLLPEYESPGEKLLEWMEICHEVLGIGSFVIVNSGLYFTCDELKTIEGEASSAKHSLLLIDHFPKDGVTNLITIDKDNCEIF